MGSTSMAWSRRQLSIPAQPSEWARWVGELQEGLRGEAGHLENARLGGLLASGTAGPLKPRLGQRRDFCMGIQFVTADGKVVKGGGRVVKNVAGYDLMKLLTGSYGSLAVITRANFKVFPRPRQTRTFACSFHSLEEALLFRTRLFQSPLTPMCMEIVSPGASEDLQDQGTVRDPDDYAPEQPVSLPAVEWQIVLRATGSDTVLARYARELGSAVTHTLAGAEEDKFWGWISHFEQSVLARRRNAMMLYTHLAIQNVGPALQAMQRVAPDYTMIPAAVGRAGTGTLVLPLMPFAVYPPSPLQYAHRLS